MSEYKNIIGVIISPIKKVFRGLSCWRCLEAEPLAPPRKTRRYRGPQKFFTEKLLWLSIVISILFLIYGCAQISQQQAEKIAKEFVAKRVRFFTKDGNSTSVPPKYSIEIISIYKEGKDLWVVLLHISADIINVTKKNDLVVKINSEGIVKEFNGAKV